MDCNFESIQTISSDNLCVSLLFNDRVVEVKVKDLTEVPQTAEDFGVPHDPETRNFRSQTITPVTR